MQHHHPDQRRAFTLIELMMALAMGSMIILVATTGVRAASQTLTATNRLSLLNNLLREGFISACNEVDFWERADDPGYPDRQTLRKPAIPGLGTGPFTPFQQCWPSSKLKTSYIAGQAERRLGWDPSPMAWASFDPRTWCRVNGAERATYSDSSDLRFGDYALFEHVDPEHPNPHIIYNPIGCRSWYGNQIKGVIDAIGLYGFCEYLPSNLFWAYHGPAPLDAQNNGVGNITIGSMPAAMLQAGGWLCVDDGPQSFMRGRYRATRCASIPMPNPDPGIIKTSFPPYSTSYSQYGRSRSADPHRTWWLVGEDIDKLQGAETLRADLVNKFLACTTYDENLMIIRPSEWPDMTINVHRYVKNSRMVSLCMLEIYDPGNGSRTTLPFSCFGTTLRGARQQRSTSLANGGWSTYNNTNPNQIVLSPTLDWKNLRTIAW